MSALDTRNEGICHLVSGLLLSSSELSTVPSRRYSRDEARRGTHKRLEEKLWPSPRTIRLLLAMAGL